MFATLPPVKSTRRPTPAPKPRPAQDLAALLAQRPDLVAAALASPVDLDGHSPDATDIRRRYGVGLAAQLYPDAPGLVMVTPQPRKSKTTAPKKLPFTEVAVSVPVARLAVETIIAELRLKPGNPKLPEAIALLAGQKDDARRQARWLARVLREWPRADVGFDLARYFSPERRAALAGHDSARPTSPESRARAVLLDAVIDREKLRRALLALAQHADATQDHERLARNVARILSFAGQRCREEGFRLICRRHFAQLAGLSAGQRFDFARKEFPDIARDGEGKSSDEAAFRRAWQVVAAEHV